MSEEDALDAGGASSKMPESLNKEGQSLVLNGCGYRRKLKKKNMYQCGLYLGSKQDDATSIIEADEPMAIRMRFVFKIPKRAMVKMMDKGFSKATDGDLAPIKDTMESLYKQLPGVLKTGDIVELIYLPDRGVVCFINGEEKGSSEGLRFKQLMFSIWLGEQPISETLRDELLGK